MNYYIATRLDRVEQHNKVRDFLLERGYELTYDWTHHGSVQNVSLDRLNEVAHRDLQGVMDADFVIVMLPGGFGTHTELGAAIASGKKVFIHTEDHDHFQLGEKTIAFYHHDLVTHVHCSLDNLDQLADVVDSHFVSV